MARTHSQNLLVRLVVREDDEDDWPLGGALMRALVEHLHGEGLALVEDENPRDGQWLYVLTVGAARLELSLQSGPGDDTWFVQIAVADEPGVLRQLLGKKVVVRDAEVLRVAHAVDRGVRAAGGAELRWCRDDLPGPDGSTPTPQ